MPNSIDKKKCRKCKLCINVCPNSIISINSDGEVAFIPERESICVKCGHCMAVCPSQAVLIDRISYERDLFDIPEHNTNYQNFMNFLYNRRSVRNFKEVPVPEDILQKIIDSVDSAPSGAAPEKVHITVINNREVIASALPKISAFYDNIVSWLSKPLIRFIMRYKISREKYNTLLHHVYPIAKSGNYHLENGDHITRNAPAIIIFHAEKDAEEHTNNSLIYATYAMLAAHSLGLGATMIGLVPAAINKVKDVREIFRIPEDHEAIISVIIGYPKFPFKRTLKRKVQTVTWI